MRNLYKYTRLYSHAEPVLVEGDVFTITIPLKKPEVNVQKSDIDNKKSEVGIQNPEFNVQNSEVQVSKISLETLKRICKDRSYNVTVMNSMEKLYAGIADDQVFGASDIEKILGCAKSTAAEMMRKLRDMDVVVHITGKGKGKYRLKYETEVK